VLEVSKKTQMERASNRAKIVFRSKTLKAKLAQFNLQKNAKLTGAAPRVKKLQFKPVVKKTFIEEPLPCLHLELTRLKTVPQAACRRPKPSRRPFLLIRENEFPNLFKDPVVQHQKMSKYLDEQDFNSDGETIERNKADLLNHVDQAITRFSKGDPSKFIENLAAPNEDISAAHLLQHINQVKAG